MRAHSIAIILLTSTLLAACGDTEKTSYNNPVTGEAVTVQSGSGIPAPTNMPDFAPVYPGGKIENVMQGTSSDASGGQRGGMVSFATDAAPDTVAAFYREKFGASNLTDRNDLNMNGTLMLTAAAPGDSDRGAQVSIVPAADGSGSQVTLIYNLGGG
jgi:hypothetical protein